MLLATVKNDCRRIVGEHDNVYWTGVLLDDEMLNFQKRKFAEVALSGKAIVDQYAVYMSPHENNAVSANYLLGASLTRTGRAPEGESYLRAALANFDPAKGVSFPVYGNPETALGDCLLAQKRYAEAEPMLLAGLAELEPHVGVRYGLNSQDLQRAQNQARQRLHDFYLAWNKPEQAARFATDKPTLSGSTP